MPRGSHSTNRPARSAVAGLSARLARDNRHLALAFWLITFVPAAGSLALHAYTARWLHWADVLFFCAVGLGLAVAWAGEQAKRARA